MRRLRYSAAMLGLASGCTFITLGTGNSDGDGGVSGSSDGTAGTASNSADEASLSGASAEGTQTSADSTVGVADTGETSAGTNTGPGNDSGTGVLPGQALLQIEEAPTFDYGQVTVTSSAAALVTVANVGLGPATAIEASLAGPFDFVGGGYPGTGGDCGATIDEGDQCEIEIAFAPPEFGPLQGDLTLDYDDGVASPSVTVDLIGDGTGSTGELLVNGGGEDCAGGSAIGWTDEVPGVWVCDGGLVYQGSQAFRSTTGPDDSVFELYQDIDVSGYDNAIDNGSMTFDFSGFARALDPGDDSYRISVHFHDDQYDLISGETSDWQTGDTWTEWATSNVAPTGTRTIAVRLNCIKTNFLSCNAYFDELSLTGGSP